MAWRLRRAMTLYVARRSTGLSLRELGVHAGDLDYSAVAAAIKRFEKRMEKDKHLRTQTAGLLANL